MDPKILQHFLSRCLVSSVLSLCSTLGPPAHPLSQHSSRVAGQVSVYLLSRARGWGRKNGNKVTTTTPVRFPLSLAVYRFHICKMGKVMAPERLC